MSDEWETFCDVSYYHMWRLRRKTERGWNDGFHINTKAEAEGLCELLNKLERERDEWANKWAELSRSCVKDTVHWEEKLNEWRTLTSWGGTPEIINDFIKGQQSRICAAQEAEEQRDRLAEALREIAEGSPWGRRNAIWIAEQALAAVKGGSDE